MVFSTSHRVTFPPRNVKTCTNENSTGIPVVGQPAKAKWHHQTFADLDELQRFDPQLGKSLHLVGQELQKCVPSTVGADPAVWEHPGWQQDGLWIPEFLKDRKEVAGVAAAIGGVDCRVASLGVLDVLLRHRPRAVSRAGVSLSMQSGTPDSRLTSRGDPGTLGTRAARGAR